MTQFLPARCCAIVLPLLAACGSLPTAGPSSSEVVEGVTKGPNPLGVRLVALTPAVTRALRAQPPRTLGAIDRLRANRAVDELGPGDVLSVSIYEAGAGLFNARRAVDGDAAQAAGSGATAETLPRLQVDRNGMIMVPYAGEIRVTGKTITQVQRTIEARLADKAAQPQVVVNLVTNGANVVYVSGDVRSPGRYTLSLAHERLLDMVALAGGPSHAPQDTLLKLNRRGQEAATSLTRVQTIAEENLAVAPQDRIQVDYSPRSYLSFGATGRVAYIPFDAANVSLAEAVARVGGLDDNRANPEATFLFRFEQRDNAQALGLVPPDAPPDREVPVIYQVNMRDPATYFAIQQFSMRDKDLIYIANAPTVQVYKFLQLVYTLATPAVTARTLQN